MSDNECTCKEEVLSRMARRLDCALHGPPLRAFLERMEREASVRVRQPRGEPDPPELLDERLRRLRAVSLEGEDE